jgi:hypothetical protein
VRRERRTLFPTELGVAVTDKLLPFFGDIMNVEFTAQMEGELDKVEEGEMSWVDTIKDFYEPFKRDLARAKKEMGSEKAGVPIGEACPECGGSGYRGRLPITEVLSGSPEFERRVAAGEFVEHARYAGRMHWLGFNTQRITAVRTGLQ